MRRAVVVPGRNLGPGVPQLLFPAIAAMRRGAEPTWVQWTDAETVDGLDDGASEEWVRARVPIAKGVTDGMLVIGKSLGTYAARPAGEHSLPAIWVTPLLTSAAVRAAMLSPSAPFLLVGGTADPFWDGDFARSVTPHVLELPGADHGLFVEGPLERSAANIGALATVAERFLDEVVWPVRAGR